MRNRVIFYYPQHFNRASGENAYLQPLIETCKAHKIKYLLVEEPSTESLVPSNSRAFHFNFFFYIVLGLRKIIPLTWFAHFELREIFIGKLINLISLGKFKANVYITLSNSLGGVLKGINKKSKLFDYQHGIINRTQPGFFQPESLEILKIRQTQILVHGKYFQDVFLKNSFEFFFDKVHIIGYPLFENKQIVMGESIVISFQIIESENIVNEWFSQQVDLVYQQLLILKKSKRQKEVILKPHPRSNLTFNLNKLLEFDFVRMYKSNETLKALLHITFYSTSAFEFAQKGIPTLFLYNENIKEGKTIFLEEFNYPYSYIKDISEWLNYLDLPHQKEEIEQGLKNWFLNFYQPYNETEFLRIINLKF